MATDFKYASQSDLEMYYPAYSQYDAKRQIFGWAVLSSNKYVADNTGLVTKLFMDGEDLSAAQGSSGAVDGNYDWHYSSTYDRVYLYNSTNSPADLVMEGGQDNATYFDQMLVNASMELNNLLDRRYPTPIPKYTQYDGNTAYASSATEYDAVIVRATCSICYATLLRSNGKYEEATLIYNEISNTDRSGIIDRLNAGEGKLAYEVDSGDSKGKVITNTKTGSMDIVETGGAYTGEPYEQVRITCTTAGAYGVAKIKKEYYGSKKIYGSETTNIDITGGLQEIHNGWYCRFQGSSMSEDDQWEIILNSESREITNAESGAIQLTRKGYGI